MNMNGHKSLVGHDCKKYFALNAYRHLKRNEPHTGNLTEHSKNYLS